MDQVEKSARGAARRENPRALRALLDLRDAIRPLAADGHRAQFWDRHARNGIILSEVVAAVVAAYVMLAPSAAHNDPVVLLLATGVAAGSPLLLLLPVTDMVRDLSGNVLFYGWSAAAALVIAVAAVRDGGVDSPLSWLLFLTLAYMAMAYPPAAVGVIGCAMTAVYVVVICGATLDHVVGFVTVTMLTFTGICTLTAQAQWRAHDEQVLALRTQETLASTDPLTNALNRRAFLARLQMLSQEPDSLLLVGVVDLDGFKAVNDGAGHAAGDEVLVHVASALRSAVRETDTVARLGGDEFAVLIGLGPGDDVEVVAGRLRSRVAAAGASQGVTASVGYAVLRDASSDVSTVLRRADRAMYEAKRAGGNRARGSSNPESDNRETVDTGEQSPSRA